MPGSTGGVNAIPYMVDGDPLADVATIMQTLAEQVDKRLPATGSVSVTATAAAFGLQAVTFPAGKFTTTPRVVATVQASNTSWYASVSSASTTGCNIAINHRDGTAATATLTVAYAAFPA